MNESYLRKVFNRHADQGPPLTLSTRAFNLAVAYLGSNCDVSAVTGIPDAEFSNEVPVDLEQFKSSVRPSGADGNVDLEAVFLQFADMGGLLSFQALANALKDIDLAIFSERTLAADQLLARAGASQRDAISFSGCGACDEVSHAWPFHTTCNLDLCAWCSRKTNLMYFWTTTGWV